MEPLVPRALEFQRAVVQADARGWPVAVEEGPGTLSYLASDPDYQGALFFPPWAELIATAIAKDSQQRDYAEGASGRPDYGTRWLLESVAAG